jgi:hypothetical protein
MESYRVGRIRAVSRRRMIAWVSVLGIVGLAAAANARYFRNVAHGPRKVAEDDLARIEDPEREPDYYVRVTGTRSVDTGIQHVIVSNENGREVSRTVDASFVGLRVGDKDEQAWFRGVRGPGSLSRPQHRGVEARLPAPVAGDAGSSAAKISSSATGVAASLNRSSLP